MGRQQQDIQECNNQKRELEAILNQSNINLSMKVLSARKGFQAEYRQLYTQNQKLDYLDMNLVKKAILEFAVAEKKKKEDEESQRKKSEESKRNAEKTESDELLRQHQEQAVVRLVDELMKINPNLKNE